MASPGKELVETLLKLCSNCNHKKGGTDSYSCPSFIDYIRRPLALHDIPMESSPEDERLVRRNPTDVPWEDSIKNFVLDLASLKNKKELDTIVLLCSKEYRFPRVTSICLAEEHLQKFGVIVEVVPCENDASLFTISVIGKDSPEPIWTTMTSELTSQLSVWSEVGTYATLCHDTSISAYRDVLYILAQGHWSISCTPRSFVARGGSESDISYICSIFSCSGSLETRAVSGGIFQIYSSDIIGSYRGKLNYYSKCIRGSTHSSGRCYDCQTLYTFLHDRFAIQSAEEPVPEITFTASITRS